MLLYSGPIPSFFTGFVSTVNDPWVLPGDTAFIISTQRCYDTLTTASHVYRVY